MKHGLLFSLFIWSVLFWALSGCSVRFEVGYHGETGRDDRTVTQPQRKAEKY